MRIAPFALACLALTARAQDLTPTPRPAGPSMPEPPAQRAPWTPPATRLPRFLLNAATALFEQGLADPRGGSYREVRLESERDRPPDPAMGQHPLHAWVIPARDKGGSRFAVGWDGLVHPLSAIGPPASLDDDLRPLIAARPPEGARAAFGRRGFGGGGAWDDRMMASQETAHPLKVVLLLRLGRADLAEGVWAVWTGWTPDRPKLDLAGYGASYLSMAQDWAWSLLDRAVTAHARGDDPLALASLRELDRIRPLIEAKAQAMGFSHGQGVNGEAKAAPYITFLHQFPALLADQERRLREPGRRDDPTKLADRDARIAALIRDFDRIAVESYAFPGRANPASASVVGAVIKEGDAAVGPLLACLERDDRLTRTVDRDNRHNSRYVHVQGVDEVAFAALVQFLGTREFGPVSRYYNGSDSDRGRRAAVAAEIRAYWEKNRGASPEERWYRTLLDDKAIPAQWLDAAEALTQPSDVQGRNGSYAIPHRFGDKAPPPRGESLRGRESPSVADLMARRVESIDPSGAALTQGLKNPRGGSGEIFPVIEADRMARLLVRWDLAASLPTLRARVARCRAIVEATRGEGLHEQALKTDIAAFTLDRLRGGDPKALDDYAAFARGLLPNRIETIPVAAFEPMWRYPDRPAVSAAADALFADPKSPWVPLFRPRQRGWSGGGIADMLTSPLLGVRPFRALVLAGLADGSETATVLCDANGKVQIDVDEGWTSFYEPKADPLRPRPSTRMRLRMADLYAWKIQGLGGTPRIELYWPEADRIEAVARCAAFLRQYGERFRWTEAARPAPFSPQRHPAVLAFDPLDHPATRDDVRDGRAIFALDGAEVRRWPMPSVPMKARWTTLAIPDDDPGLASYDLAKGRPTGQVAMLQGGSVWQAEEVREGGRWRRYYGFAGRFRLARVPAEEVEFPAEWNTPWQPTANDLDGRLGSPSVEFDGLRFFPRVVGLGGPLPVEAWLRNHAGLDRPAPVDNAREGPGRGLALREGVSIRLFRFRDDPKAPRPLYQPWPTDEVAPKPISRFETASFRGLHPTEVVSALRLDLRDLFDVTKPGRYRLELSFGAPDEPAPLSAWFSLTDSSKAE